MTEEEKTATLPSDVTDFLGMGQRRTGGYDTLVRPPSFAGGTDEFTDRAKKERRARFKASADMLFSTDVSKLDDAGASALYQSVTEGMFGLPDEDGSVAFGKRASKDPRANIEMLRKFVKGDYALIEDPEYTKWRQMDDEAKFKYALENETKGNALRSHFKGERGLNLAESAALGAAATATTYFPSQDASRDPAAKDISRRMDYNLMTDEEKEKYRADVIGDYEEKLSRRQTLATFLQFAHGLSDRAGYLLAKSFNDGTVDLNVETLVGPDGDTTERDRVYAAFSLMRGNQKKGRILGVQTDFTDDTVANRLQLGLYGFQQSVVGLVTDTADLARDAAMWTYAKTAMDEAERKEFFKGWDANVRAEQAMKQSLPEADSLFGEAFQGLAENMHWFIPYSMIGKGGKMVNAARGFKEGENALKGWKKVFQPLKDLKVTLTPMRLGGDLKKQKAVAETSKAIAEANVAATRAAYTLDINGVKKLGDMGSAILTRQMAAVDRYTQMLRGVEKDLEAAKWWKDAAGTTMWAVGEASAFSAFASEYIANADAAGISREESVLTAAAIGFINAQIERLYVPGLESSLTPAQIKSLMFTSMAQAIKTDGAAGFRRWLANRVSKGVTEGVKVTLTEGLVEEPLQQMAIEHGKAFDKLCGELRANGQATLANEAKALWDSFAATLPNDYATFIDTAADMVPSSLGFGVTTIGNMTRRQHIRNAMTRHANRRAGSTSTMMTAQTMQELQGATDYDAGLVDVIQQAVNVRAAVEKHWQGEEDGGEAKNPHRFEEAITAARRAWRNPQTRDAVQEIADAAGVDVKTAEVLAQYLQTEAEAAAFSPQARAWTSLNMSLADIDEATIKTVLPGYVEGSFASDPENGIYSGRVRMDDGTEKTIAYRVGDLSAELVAEAQNMAKADSSFGKSFDARHAELGDGVTWASLSDAQRYAEAVRSQASVNGFSTGKSGVFELTDSKGEKVRVNADDIIYLANGRIGDIGYGPAATQGTVRHETFHSLWRFVRGTLADADVQQLAKTLGIDVTNDGWEVELDEKMAHEMERYASGHYVSHAVSSRFDKMLDSWAGKIINFFGQFGPSDEVTDPKTGKPYQLKGLYDSILRGELGSGTLGVELRKVPAQPAPQNSPDGRTASGQSSMPIEVTDADRAEADAAMRGEAVDENQDGEGKLAQDAKADADRSIAEATQGVDETSLADAILVHLESGSIDYRFKDDAERGACVEAAKKVFSEYARKKILLPTGRYLYFAPDAAMLERAGGNHAAAWAEYALHLVTHESDDAATGTKYREFIQDNVDYVLPKVEEIVSADEENCDPKPERNRVYFYRQEVVAASRKKSRRIMIAAALDGSGNLNVDLVYRTGVYQKGYVPTKLVSLRDAIGSRTAKGQTPTDPNTGRGLEDGTASQLRPRAQNGLSRGSVPQTSVEVKATSENPADAATPNQVYYRVGLPNSPVKLVGRLEVRDVETGVITSTDADYHDRGNQNRDDKSEESRALVEKIGANPDPLQIGTVQPIASNGIIWMLPNGDVIIGNHRVNGVRLGYAKGTTAELERFVREDAAKRGIEIGADVKKPLMVFVLERIESPDGKADVHEVVRLANESQNRGFNIREQAGNDAKILTDNNLLPRMEFRADGRIDETKSGDAIGKFRQESGAQGLIAEDGSLTEGGQTRIQNAALAVLLGGEGNNALLNKIMTNAGRLDMQTELRALMKMTPELMALAESKPAYDLRGPIAEALQLFTEWRDKDETARVEKGKTRHDWREMVGEAGRRARKRGLSWEAFMSQGDMFRKPSDEAKILGDLFAKAESLRSFDREDVESAAGKKRVIDLISDYLADYIANARAVNTETDDMFGGSPASRADVLAAQRATGGEDGGPRFSVDAVEAQRQYDEVVARYTNPDGTRRRGWMRAPNGQPTKLAERQWVQVRTPAFKAWFGDWESDAELAPSDMAGAKSSFRALMSGNVEIRTADGATLRFVSQSAKAYSKEAEHESSSKAAHWAALANIEGLVARSRFMFEEKPRNGSPDIEAYVKYGTVFTFGGEKYLAKITSKRYAGRDAQNFYSVESVSVEKIDARGIHEAIAKGQPLDASDVDRISNILSAVNGEDAISSKVVDENGEPLVVWHGDMDPSFPVFDKGKIQRGTGFWFAKEEGEAASYALDAEPRAFYLNIRNPARGGRYSVSGIYTGTAADYANRSRQGGRDDGPSVKKIGTGEGSQVYGWGLYGSTVRGVAEGYAENGTDYRRDAVALARRYYKDYGSRAKAYQALFEETRSPSVINYREKMDALWLLSGKAGTAYKNPLGNLYEQTFFTDRAPGDESHLLKWYEPVSKEHLEWIKAQAEKEGIPVYEYGKGKTGRNILGKSIGLKVDGTGGNIYEAVKEGFEWENGEDAPRLASEFLARAGIDGVKYPVDSYGGKGVKDGDKAGWNYVSFRDDNIRVDHKWTDGEMRYSIAQTTAGEKFVLLDRPNTIDWNDRDKVREYLATLVGSGAVSLADERRIEIGKDLPDEYTRSRYAEKAFRNVRLRKVRGKTAQHLDELIAVSGERAAEPSKHKKREGGVYYRRAVNFGVFGHEVKRGYSAELVSYEENGQEYLYDLVNIKDNPSLVPDSATGGNGGFEILSTYNGEGSEVPEGTPDSIPQTGAPAQGRRYSVSGIYTGTAADYANRSRQGGVDDGPSLIKIGTANGVAFGWGLYGSTAKSDAEGFGGNVVEQTFFTNRAPGDESHLIEWRKPLSDENRERILDGLVYRARHNENLKKAIERNLAEEARDYGLDQSKDYVPEEVEGMADDVLREAIERTIDVQTDRGENVYKHLAALLTGKTLGEVNNFKNRTEAYKTASEFLRDECDIDGIKYPAEADGAKAGETHYVSFRDDNIRVDHKWTDGKMRYSVSKELTDAMRKREAMQSIPVEGKVQPWPENFPKVMLQTTLANIRQKWPELHAAAKAGSDGAALELVRNVLGEERVGNKANPKWEKLRVLADAHPRAIVAYVHAEEATGRNKIPVAYAAMIEHITGLRAEPDIVQTVRAHHTGANAVERMTRRAAFDGPVRRGAEYILVDDHVTQGGTLNELRKYIQSRGGKVVAVTTLTASQFSDTLSISRDAVLGLYTKFGNNLDEELQKAGIANGVAELTQSQARELLKLRADTLRDRLAQARLARQSELDAQAVRLAGGSRVVSGATDLLPGLKAYLKPDGTFTETGTRWAKAKQFQRAIGRELNSLIDECLNASADMPAEQTAAELERLIAAAEATDEIRNGVLPNFRSDSALDDPAVMPVGPDGKKAFTPERAAIHQRIYDVLMADRITDANNEALETEKDGSAKEESVIVRANEGRPELPPISLQNPSYETAKEFRVDIIVGPPAAGKSSVFANALSVFYRSRVLDCDAVKKMLPGFNDGNGANYVHAESSDLNKRMIFDIQHRAEGDPRRGENVVLPVLGNDVEGLRKKIADWHAAGYTVYLHNNRVPILHAFGRAVIRTLATGRWINPAVIRACQDNPTRAYNLVKKEADYYDQFSNDVQYGERPIWEDGNYADPAYGRNIRRLDESGVQGSHDGKGVDGRLERDGVKPVSQNGQYLLPGAERWSTEAPRSGLVYPQLRSMSDDELLSAAVAVRMALGTSDKLSDKTVKINTVQKIMRRLHPDWDGPKIGLESQRVLLDARKFGKRIREDLNRGVSDSLILEHLPQAAREQFGLEMRQEARKGQSLGAFGQKVASAIEERQARVVEDAVRVQTGIDASIIENVFGIDLSATLMHLAENPLSQDDGKGVSGTGAGKEENAAPAEEKDVEAKVVEAVSAVVDTARQRADENAEIRRERKAHAEQKKNDGEAEGETGDESGDALPGDAEDAVAVAVKKAGLDLENPRHLAEFVAELTRRYWIKEHELAITADVWRDLVAVQFLRKTAQSVYAKLCKDLVYSRSRETAMQRIAKFDAVPTVAGLLSEMEFVGALINAQRIRDTQKQLCERLDLFLRQKFGAQGRFKPDKEEGKRSVSAEAELRARYMRHAMWLTPDAAADEARQLQETLDALSVDFKDAGRDRDQSREFVETIRKLNVLREFGALRYKPVGEIEAAAQWWEDFARGESDDIVREMSDRDIRTKKAAHLLAVAFADPKRTTIREGGKADALNRFITGHMGFISLLQDCMRHASDADAAAVKDIVDYISREIQKSGDRSEAEKRRHNDAFHSAVEGIYGKSFNAVMKDMMAPDERFTKYMGVVGGKRVTPTKGRALQLLVSLLQEGRKVQVEDEDNPGQTKTVWEGGYHDNIVKHHREGQAAEIMRLLDPADMNMLKWLGQWYELNRSDLSGVCHSLFGIGVYAELPNYFPVKMMLETQGLEKGQGVGWTIFPKALTPRVRNERDFDTSADIFSMWASRMEEAAQWKHHAQLGLEMRGIFGRAELREAVRANHGASVDDLMQGFITDILAGHGAYDRSTAGVQYFSDQIRGWTALCALGGNVGVMVKQPTSIPAFGFEIGLVNTVKYMVNAFTPEGMAAMRRIWDSEQRRTRWQVGSSEAVRNALNQQGAGALKRMFQASMITNKLGDVVPALVVGQGIYRDCLARGMSEEDAMAETWSIIERTQQSGRMENQTSIQRRNKLGRIMFQFLSTQQQYLQYELRAIREVIARPDSVKRWGSLGRAILLNHFILSSAYYWMGQLYKYALGQEPPEDELKDWVITCLLGPYGSLFVAGFCCKYTLERAIKGYSIKGGSSMLPMESWLKNQVNDGAKLLEAIFDSDGDTWENMLEAAGRWMSDSNSTVRDLRKIYRYRVKGEPQRRR